MDWNDPQVVSAYQRKYRARHKEQLLAYQRAYAAAHRDAAKARAQAWYRANTERAATGRKRRYNPTKAKEYNRRYREQNRDAILAYDRVRYNTPEREATAMASRQRNSARIVARVKAWCLANPERAKAMAITRDDRRRARVAGVRYERINRADIARRDKQRCGICGKRVKLADRSLDHIVPLALGGAHIVANVQLAHLSCNKRKGARLLNAQPFLDL